MSSYDPTVLRTTIESAISEGESHLRQRKRAVTLLSHLFPLPPETLHSLPDDTVPILDQFIYRLTKLQDSMASRLLPSLHSLLRADNAPRWFLDVLAYLEKLGVLSSEEELLFFRVLRNNLAHDHPESADQTAQTLNTLHDRWRDIRLVFVTARDYYRGWSV